MKWRFKETLLSSDLISAVLRRLTSTASRGASQQSLHFFTDSSSKETTGFNTCHF